ncbi:MAG: leucine--tRNA ligase [Planctomycetes bacterium]|nr:leucine--tRNA ligase [Planctomycetota bacterium]
MAGYDFTAIEARWQAYWAEHGTFRVANPGQEGFVDRPKAYILDMFPYPSGAGLHVGHPEGYTATDIVARYRRMRGYNVLHPMGYDAFGLPAEQYAVEHGVHPRVTTERNIANIERQIKLFGFSYDWSRRVSTTDVAYYRWTQWIFLRMFNSWYDPDAGKARPIGELVHALERGDYYVDLDGGLVPSGGAEATEALAGVPGALRRWHELQPDQQRRLLDEYRLAYQAEVPVNWCPALGTVLANEEVTNEGRSERGNHPVYRRPLKQWMLRITAYAERLADDLAEVDWPEPIKMMQRNWIGRSVGAEVDFRLAGDADAVEDWFADRAETGFPAVADEDVIRVFTTRPDTLFGATYMVLAPEHPLVATITTDRQRGAVEAYVAGAAHKSEMERTAEAKTKTGVFTGASAINPVTGEPIPIWVADYVMMGYGTGAIMAVPAHDTRDLEFAEQFDLPVVQVVQPVDGGEWRGFVDEGVAVNSGDYNGLLTAEFKTRITDDLDEAGLGRRAVNYKIRDWLFSRQRYWGEPFPIVHCDTCGTVALGEDDLPLELPDMEDFTPATSDDPEALPAPPLGKATDWAATTCPICGEPATRELNTMPQWAGSCWYFLRYLDPANDRAFCDGRAERYWMGPKGRPVDGQSPMGVDLYVGGAEHAVLHLLYARFWHKVLFDLGYVSFPEPFGKLFNQGMIRSFAYRDARGVCVGYDQIDFREDGAYRRTTGEKLVESIEKMSKSLKNVVNPDEIVAQFGADTFRLYEMFMGPLEASKPWNTRDVPGVHRFCQRVWRMIAGTDEQPALLSDGDGGEPLERALHKTIKKVGEDIEAMKFNTAIAAMMEFVNAVYRAEAIGRSQAERFVLVLAPFAPHLCEELWQRLGHGASLAHEPFPAWDEAMTVDATVELPVQINGKVRGRVTVAAGADEQTILDAVTADARISEQLAGKTIVKKIVIPGRLVNLVIR